MKQVIVVFICFFTLPLVAQHRELIIKADTKVYKKQNTKDILITLEAGARVPISTQDYGRWVKIKAEVAGKWYYGWIPKRELRGFKTRKVDRELIAGKRKSYHRKKGIGVFTNFAYASVADQEFSDASSNNITVTGATGTSLFFGFHYDHPLSDTKQLHTYLALREHEVSGDAKLNTAPNEIEIDLNQSFIGIGASIKNYKDRDANFWWSYGLEVAKTSDMQVELVGVSTDVPDEEFDFFILPHIGAGYDYRFLDKLYLIPEAKLNLAANAGGLSYNIDFKLAISYAF